jgi:hypothetical protein
VLSPAAGCNVVAMFELLFTIVRIEFSSMLLSFSEPFLHWTVDAK